MGDVLEIRPGVRQQERPGAAELRYGRLARQARRDDHEARLTHTLPTVHDLYAHLMVHHASGPHDFDGCDDDDLEAEHDALHQGTPLGHK